MPTQAQYRLKSAAEQHSMTGETTSHLNQLGIHPDIFLATHTLACRYATSGIEGVKKGHILVVGDPSRIMKVGSDGRPCYAFVKGGAKGDRFCGGCQHVTVHEDAEIVMKGLNYDGMTVIDGQTGVVVHNSVFSRIISERFQGGGARAAASAGLADAAQCVCIMVSEDPPPPLGWIRTFWGSDTHFTEERLSHGRIESTSTRKDDDPLSDLASFPSSSPRTSDGSVAMDAMSISTVASNGSSSPSTRVSL